MNQRPLCQKCNKNLCKKQFNVKSSGEKVYYFAKVCTTCQRFSRFKHRRIMEQELKLMKCQKCEFLAVHQCQLDVDHKDGNKRNNRKANLVVLCANCHRLKTMEYEDWERKDGLTILPSEQHLTSENR